jgi:hypothetical protein
MGIFLKIFIKRRVLLKTRMSIDLQAYSFINRKGLVKKHEKKKNILQKSYGMFF